MLTRDAFPQPEAKAIAITGDSMCLNEEAALSIGSGRQWPTILNDLLLAAGCHVAVRNYGRSGADSSGDNYYLLYRHNWTLYPRVPEVTVIWIGTNDYNHGLSTAQTTANVETAILWSLWGCAGYAATESALPSGSPPGERRVVAADSTHGNAHAVWKAVDLRGGTDGWRYLAGLGDEADGGCPKILVVGMHYRNFYAAPKDVTTGGVTTWEQHYEDTRVALQAAVTACAVGNAGVVYWNIGQVFAQRIIDGLDTQGSFSWHPADGNQHLNAYGNQIAAQAVYDELSDLGWLEALT